MTLSAHRPVPRLQAPGVTATPTAYSRGPRTISVVLPAYNEEAVIGRTVAQTVSALRRLELDDYEVLVVDDGSGDRTAAEVLAVAAHTPRVKVLRHRHNQGYGGALRSGFDAAAFEGVFLMDSDGQFDPAEVARLVECWDGRTAVFGYRAQRNDPWYRRLNHWAFFTLVRLLMGPTTRDVNCAFKLFPRELGVGLSSSGAVISTELMLRARRAGMRIVEVPVNHLPRTTGSPTGARLGVIVHAFAELWSLRRDALGSGRAALAPVRDDRAA